MLVEPGVVSLAAVAHTCKQISRDLCWIWKLGQILIAFKNSVNVIVVKTTRVFAINKEPFFVIFVPLHELRQGTETKKKQDKFLAKMFWGFFDIM